MPPKFGVSVSWDRSKLAPFEKMVGRQVDFVEAHGGSANWDDFKGSAGWVASELKQAGRAVRVTQPLLPQGASLSQARGGTYDSWYNQASHATWDQFKAGTGDIVVRIGTEQNGDWMPWSAIGKEADYIASYRRMAGFYRGKSSRFKFEWAPNYGQTDPAKSYPATTS